MIELTSNDRASLSRSFDMCVTVSTDDSLYSHSARIGDPMYQPVIRSVNASFGDGTIQLTDDAVYRAMVWSSYE